MFSFNKKVLATIISLTSILPSLYAQYPSRVQENKCGKCLIATQDIARGTLVERFEGPKVKYEDVPLEEICYVGCHGDGFWTIPVTSARYINHSCDPNCAMKSSGDVVAFKSIVEGEEITFDYVTITREMFEKNPQNYFWDPRWSFKCLCNAPNCHRNIDHYIIKD